MHLSLTTAPQASGLAAHAALITQNLDDALAGPGAGWVRAALRQAQTDPVAAALQAAVLANALALQATRFLEAEQLETAATVEQRYAS